MIRELREQAQRTGGDEAREAWATVAWLERDLEETRRSGKWRR